MTDKVVTEMRMTLGDLIDAVNDDRIHWEKLDIKTGRVGWIYYNAVPADAWRPAEQKSKYPKYERLGIRKLRCCNRRK